jgi:hypothetical protein
LLKFLDAPCLSLVYKKSSSTALTPFFYNHIRYKFCSLIELII